MKVLIVDDEQIVRVGLSTLIPWEDYGYTLTADAKHGKQALQYVEQYKPHIIITDIKMPIMDGINLIEALNERGYQGEIIVLSNYSDFDLVKAALKKGAMDYLLKLTLKKEELLDVLNQAKEKIQRKRLVEETQDNIVKQQQQIILDNFIHRVIKDNGEIDIYKEMERLYIEKDKLDQRQFIYIYLYGGENEKVLDEEYYTKTISNLLRNSLSGDGHMFIPLNKKEYLILLDKEYMYIQQALPRLKKTLNLYINANYKTSTGLLNDFIQIKQLIERERTNIFYGDDSVEFHKTTINYQKYSLRIREFLEGNNHDQVSNMIKNVLELAKSEKWEPIEVKKFLNFIIDSTKQHAAKWKGQDFELFHEVKNKLICYHMMDEWLPIIEGFIEQVECMMKQLKSTVYRQEILDIMQYISNHITMKVQLSELAQKVNLNESYLCRVFKKETGKSITEYHNDMKIEKAKELLRDRNLLIKEIALEVGIDNPNYFNRLFHKIVGISPKEYRNHL